jgi:broad specificity phosphatase PhoE
LAERLAEYHPGILIASLEPKATETGHLVAVQLGVPFETAEDLHEHDRSNVGYTDRATFERAVAEFFARPNQLIFGGETAEQTHRRFAQAVHGAIERYADRNIVIVAHGTVISLFVAHATGVEPFGLWQRLGLPSFVVLSRPELTLLNIVACATPSPFEKNEIASPPV